jgi:hypothetical protein
VASSDHEAGRALLMRIINNTRAAAKRFHHIHTSVVPRLGTAAACCTQLIWCVWVQEYCAVAPPSRGEVNFRYWD